jgi:dolichol-phosphate mannosyltransferase
MERAPPTKKALSIIIPVYKEALTIKPFLARLEPLLEKMGLPYEILFCLDPSPDQTQDIVQEEINRNPHIKLIVFSRRFGQPAATMAGILTCAGETCVVIDVDLQDPPALIETMYQKLHEGYEVVYAKRQSRKSETLPKRIISYLGYKIINKLTDMRIPPNTGDFRIMTRRVIEELRKLQESHGFLRGLMAYIGFKQAFIEYNRDERFAGKGNYNRFTGSLKIGLNGLISFSSRPLQMMSILGAGIAGFNSLPLSDLFISTPYFGILLSIGMTINTSYFMLRYWVFPRV